MDIIDNAKSEQHMNKIPKIYALGTRFNNSIFDGEVVIEEKIDGSQFSFQFVGCALTCRSKSTVINPEDPGMFKLAVEKATALAAAGKLQDGWIYQCEFLAKPKHNCLAYDRAPDGNLVLFDVKTYSGYVSNPAAKYSLALTLGIEPVPLLYHGNGLTTFSFPTMRDEWLNRDSILGGQKIEGFVIKNYMKQHPESESGVAPMTAKVVSDRFKEKMKCRPMNPKAGPGEFVQALINSLRTEPRWLKAIQHLKEAGQLQNDNRDIGPLCREIQRDILEEESEWIKEQLFKEFSKEITKGSVQGFAQFYQRLLTEGPTVFEQTEYKL